MKHYLTDKEIEAIPVCGSGNVDDLNVAKAQYDKLLARIPKSEDLSKWAIGYFHGYITIKQFQGLLKKKIFGE